MTLHKLTAGDGYTYLTRQVAAQDATTRGHGDLGSYYRQRGEAPGVWMGSGCAAVPHFAFTGAVTEAQMRALFGEGRHPNADAIELEARRAGCTPEEVDRSSRLGRTYPVREQAGLFHRVCAGAFRDYNTARGLDAGTPVPAEVRARLRTDIATGMFREEFGRAPADARELHGHLARISRQATTAVAGYDLTFSPVKSVSTLWAVAPLEVARVIEAAHADAVADTLAWLERSAAFTRTGRAGAAQVEVRGLIAAAFTHRDSRAGDPDLHTHVAISNKVQTLDGRWLALDGRPIFTNNVPASERYNTRLEALLIQRLGVTFADRQDDDPAKRPVREIVGVDGALTRAWSTRRAAIDTRRAHLSARFQADHGRPPTAKEAVGLAQQANLETRQRKHDPRSYAGQRAAWRTEALTVLGGEAQLHYFIRDALRGGPGPQRRLRPLRMTRRRVEQAADRVLQVVQSERATWQDHHIRAEAQRHVRGAGVAAGELDAAVDRIVTAALAPARSILLDDRDPITAAGAEPAALRRSDGSSVFTVAGAARYTSAQIIAAEETIVAAGGLTDGRVVRDTVLDLALLESTANGVTLTPGQVQLVRELATSGARVQLALAPAGTGKTTAMHVLSTAWTASGGDVIGLAPTAAAAAVLRDELGTSTDTLAKLTTELATRHPGMFGGDRAWLDVPYTDKEDAKAAGARWDPTVKAWYAPTAAHADPGGPLHRWRDWVTGIGPDTLVVIDEAGMAGTPALAAAITYVTGRGGSVRLIGDDQQLAAVGAGGALRDLAHTHGAVTLSQVLRFTDPATGAPNHAEGAASLALRDGDPAAIGYYLDHGRVHVGDLTTVTDTAYTAWAADRAAGADPVMLAPTRALVADLNARARTDRLATESAGRPVGPEVVLADGARASAGDTVITGKNNRRIAISATDWVKNGDRWRIDAVRESGALEVTHLRSGLHATLPARYVQQHVRLGYAATVHAAQGITADTCHTVATGQESRQLLYVAMTRGRHANHIYLTAAGDGDPHSVITRDALLPPTAADILTRVLARDDSPISATSHRRDLTRPDLLLNAAAERYLHALHVAAEDHLGPQRLADLDTAAETSIPGLTRAETYPALRAHLALLTLDGHQPADLLTAAARGRELGTARDVAAVLDWRLDPTRKAAGTGPLTWLPAIPAALTGDPEWGQYLHDRAIYVADLRDQVAEQARSWTPTSAPRWAATLADRDPDLLADLAVWRAAHAVDTTDRSPTGTPQLYAADARAQRGLEQRVTRLLIDPHTAPARWAPLADSLEPRITADPYWPTLAERLTAADRAGIDITALARAVAADRPLPDEQPAAALWWRLAAHLAPAAWTVTDTSAADTLRPDWLPTLTTVLGDPAAARVLADPAWPALVAAVSHAQDDGWTAEQILSTAHDLLHGAQPADEPLRADELATALVWRIGLLTGTNPTSAAAAPAAAAPADLDQLGEAAAGPDEDWVRSLLGAEPDPLAEPDPVTGPHPTQPAAAPAAAAAEPDPAEGSVISRARLVELNCAAAAFYAQQYPGSWAARYLIERLGTDLAGDPRFAVGYAPHGWTALTRHLHRMGVGDEEILAAALGSRASTGRIIDRFRDRLMFSYTATDPADPDRVEIRGFIGRRNPATEEDNAGPKYLNTAETGLFSKGHILYGLADNQASLTTGATPVVVEGPMDAIAVTLAGQDRYIGVAAVGTAFTDAQADLLRPYISTLHPTPSGAVRAPIVVATDADPAGQRAAHRAFWQLAARAEDPRQLRLPDGTDPAEYLQTHGPAALHAALEDAEPLAEQVITARTAALAHRLDSIEGRLAAMRVAADVTGARPPERWLEAATSIAAHLHVAPATVINEVLDAGHAWGSDSRGLARARLAERPPTPLPAEAPPTPRDPQQRWAPLVASFAGDLTGDPHWPVLAAHIDRAAATGYDVTHRLLVLTARRPLDHRHRARDLDLRLTADHPGCLPPADPATVRDDQAISEAAAARRMAAADRHTAHHRPRGATPAPDRAAPPAPTPAPPRPDRRPNPPGPHHRP